MIYLLHLDKDNTFFKNNMAYIFSVFINSYGNVIMSSYICRHLDPFLSERIFLISDDSIL